MASNPSSFQKNARSPRRRRRAIAARAPCGIRLVVVVEGRLGGSAGLSGDGAESRTGVMERRGWTGAEWGRGGAPFPGEAKGVAGPGGEEKGAGGVARRLPTSESKFHKKNIAGTGTGVRVPRTAPRPSQAQAPRGRCGLPVCPVRLLPRGLALAGLSVLHLCFSSQVAALARTKDRFSSPVRHVLMPVVIGYLHLHQIK
jgi:hypothetical protein